jgi:hypothetical protein
MRRARSGPKAISSDGSTIWLTVMYPDELGSQCGSHSETAVFGFLPDDRR